MQEGEEEEEGFDVRGVKAKPGNPQASALPAHSQKGETLRHPFPLA